MFIALFNYFTPLKKVEKAGQIPAKENNGIAG